MPIPEFDDNGNLPPGRHPATLEEVRSRFGGGSMRRRELFRALESVVSRLRSRGVLTILVDGSFTTDKYRPGDVDVLFDGNEVNPWSWRDELNPRFREELKKDKRVDLLPTLRPADVDFEIDEDGNSKGVVLLVEVGDDS